MIYFDTVIALIVFCFKIRTKERARRRQWVLKLHSQMLYVKRLKGQPGGPY